MKKKVTIMGVVASLLVLASLAPSVQASRRTTGSLTGPRATGLVVGAVECLVATFRSGEPITTSSTAWQNVPAMRLDLNSIRREVSTTVSVGLVGNGPVGMRVLIDGTTLQQPGEIRFDPTTGNPSFNYTFVHDVGPDSNHTFQLQWRSSFGRSVTLVRGSMNLLVDYAGGSSC